MPKHLEFDPRDRMILVTEGRQRFQCSPGNFMPANISNPQELHTLTDANLNLTLRLLACLVLHGLTTCVWGGGGGGRGR